MIFLVPTLCVGTHPKDAPRPNLSDTAEVQGGLRRCLACSGMAAQSAMRLRKVNACASAVPATALMGTSVALAQPLSSQEAGSYEDTMQQPVMQMQ